MVCCLAFFSLFYVPVVQWSSAPSKMVLLYSLSMFLLFSIASSGATLLTLSLGFSLFLACDYCSLLFISTLTSVSVSVLL